MTRKLGTAGLALIVAAGVIDPLGAQSPADIGARDTDVHEALPAALDDKDDGLDALVVSLLGIIHEFAGYAAEHERPAIHPLPQHMIEAKVCDEPCNVRAAYLPRENAIYLAADLDPVHEPAARAALLHELVHYLQQGHARFAPLPPCERDREKEREAYAIQNHYLASIGSDERVVFYEGDFVCVNGEFANER